MSSRLGSPGTELITSRELDRLHEAFEILGGAIFSVFFSVDTLMMQCCLDLHVALLWRFKHSMLVYTAYSFRARRSRRIPFRNAHKYQGGLINL